MGGKVGLPGAGLVLAMAGQHLQPAPTLLQGDRRGRGLDVPGGAAKVFHHQPQNLLLQWRRCRRDHPVGRSRDLLWINALPIFLEGLGIFCEIQPATAFDV